MGNAGFIPSAVILVGSELRGVGSPKLAISASETQGRLGCVMSKKLGLY